MSNTIEHEGSFVNTNLFTRRIPSSVETKTADVKGTQVCLKGVANSEGLQKIPANSGVCGGLDWDTIVTTGFIYTKNNLHLSVDEYSKKIKMDNMEYDFPSVENGSFLLGADTLFIVSTSNTDRDTRIEMKQTITGLSAEETYFAYAFMKYKFQTSNEYLALGERTTFTTETGLPEVEIEMDINTPTIACNDEQVVSVGYSINVEEALYKLIFSPESVEAGFVSMDEYLLLPESVLEVKLPKGVQAGNYTATMYITYESWEKSYDIELVVNSLPEVVTASEAELFLYENEEIYLFVEVEGDVEYQWYFKGNLIHGATESYFFDLFEDSKEGDYSVTISNYCGSVLHFFNVSKHPIVSIDENKAMLFGFTVYPNPVKCSEKLVLLLELPENEQPDAIAYLYDMNGRRVDEHKLNDYKTEIAVHFTDGTYLVRVLTNSGREFVHKIIVQK